MKIKSVFKCVCGIMVAVTLTACNETSIEGSWIEPVPGMENMMQGIKIEKEGKASSINMATLQYEAWKKEGNKLILSGKSIGNHQTLSFTDTLTIEKLTTNELVLKQQYGDRITNYQRQE